MMPSGTYSENMSLLGDREHATIKIKQDEIVFQFFAQDNINQNPVKAEPINANEKECAVTKTTSTKRSKWLKGWRLALLIVAVVILLGFIISLIVFESFAHAVGETIGIILSLPLLLVIFLAYADDMFARR